MINYLEILQKACSRNKSYTDFNNNLFEKFYEDLHENLSYNDLSKLNNMFILLTGISLETLFESEDVENIVNNDYYELLESIKE